MTKENKNEKWHILVNPFGDIGVYVDSDYDPFLNKITSSAVSLLPIVKATIENKDMYETYEYIVKLHNDRLRFKQKQRNKKKNRSDYTELSKNPSPADGWIVGGVPVDDSGKKICRRCKQCKDSCEFYDKGICRGIIYPMNPPKYGKCEFDE